MRSMAEVKITEDRDGDRSRREEALRHGWDFDVAHAKVRGRVTILVCSRVEANVPEDGARTRARGHEALGRGWDFITAYQRSTGKDSLDAQEGQCRDHRGSRRGPEPESMKPYGVSGILTLCMQRRGGKYHLDVQHGRSQSPRGRGQGPGPRSIKLHGGWVGF